MAQQRDIEPVPPDRVVTLIEAHAAAARRSAATWTRRGRRKHLGVAEAATGPLTRRKMGTG